MMHLFTVVLYFIAFSFAFLQHLLFFEHFRILEAGAGIFTFGCHHDAFVHSCVIFYSILLAFIKGGGIDAVWWFASFLDSNLTTIQNICHCFHLFSPHTGGAATATQIGLVSISRISVTAFIFLAPTLVVLPLQLKLVLSP